MKEHTVGRITFAPRSPRTISWTDFIKYNQPKLYAAYMKALKKAKKE